MCSRALPFSAAEINNTSFTKLGKGSLWNLGWLSLLLLSFRSPGCGDEGQAWPFSWGSGCRVMILNVVRKKTALNLPLSSPVT